MRKYELMMILNPDLEKKALDELISEIKKDLSEHGMKVTSEDVWGAKDMAYKIHGSKSGYYLLYTIETDELQKLKDTATPFNIKKDLWRYMFTKLPEDVAPKKAKPAAETTAATPEK